jgi:XTP/dITP diphosphohydrolase
MDPFLIATGNVGKFAEIHAILGDLPYAFKALTDLAVVEDGLEESGTTYEANARIKAQHYHGQVRDMWVLAEDSGIQIDALGDELGVKTRRWGAGADASDEAWLDHFMDRMAPVPPEERTARFLCAAVLLAPDGSEHVFYGESEGVITFSPEAPILSGLPLSSVFRVNGYDRVYAAMSKDEKAAVSHRGWAISKVKNFLSD